MAAIVRGDHVIPAPVARSPARRSARWSNRGRAFDGATLLLQRADIRVVDGRRSS